MTSGAGEWLLCGDGDDDTCSTVLTCDVGSNAIDGVEAMTGKGTSTTSGTRASIDCLTRSLMQANAIRWSRLENSLQRFWIAWKNKMETNV